MRTHDDYSGSAFADHLLAADHSFDLDRGAKLLHEAKKGRRLTYLENIEILAHTLDPSNRTVNDAVHIFDVVARLNT